MSSVDAGLYTLPMVDAVSADEGVDAAIAEVIRCETDAYLRKDFDNWQSYWQRSDDSMRMFSFGTYGVWTETGWDAIADTVKHFMDLHPAPSPSLSRYERWNFKIVAGADMAWVFHDQLGEETGDPFQMPGHQSELKILRKLDDGWKLTVCVSMRQNLRLIDFPLIEIGPDGEIVWINRHAALRLKAHPALTVSGRRLRARNKASQLALESAIEEVRHYRAETLVCARRDIPVVPVALTNEDHDGVSICWVSLFDHKIVTTMDDNRMIEQSLHASAAVYGLSKMQVRLCKLIVDGFDLTAAAAELGITTNTVRTHLQRIFDKTGMRSQAALVRALMSVHPPER